MSHTFNDYSEARVKKALAEVRKRRTELKNDRDAHRRRGERTQGLMKAALMQELDKVLKMFESP